MKGNHARRRITLARNFVCARFEKRTGEIRESMGKLCNEAAVTARARFGWVRNV